MQLIKPKKGVFIAGAMFHLERVHVKNNLPAIAVIYVCDFYRKSSNNNAFREM